MGTRFEMALSGASSAALRAAGEAAFDEVLDLHRLWSAFDPGSLLTRVNRLAAGRPVPVDGETFAILRLALDLWRATEGAFDPTLGARMRAAGFRGGEMAPLGPATSAGMDAVELDRAAGTVRFLQPNLELDLGALAKGYALDRVGESLRESGVPCAFVHGGSSGIWAMGTPPDTEGWPVALDSAGSLPRVHLRDASLAVSAGTGRVVEAEGALRGHVIDPAHGTPAATDRWSAVVTDSAAVADAWATALIATDRELTPPQGMSLLVGGLVDAEPTTVRRRIDPRGAFTHVAR